MMNKPVVRMMVAVFDSPYARERGGHMNDFNIACFLSVCRTLSFTISANELYISQQAVSRNIQTLEDELGFCLFHRHYHAVCPTSAGRVYYKAMKEMAKKRFDFQERIDYAQTNGALRIGYSLWSGLPFGMAADIHAFTERVGASVPGGTFELPDDDTPRFLEQGLVDIAIVTRYVATRLGADARVTPFAELPLFCVYATEDEQTEGVAKGDIKATDKTNAEAAAAAPKMAVALGSRTHFTCLALEADEETAFQRVRSEYERLDIGSAPISLLPNIESVYLEILMGNGITFSPQNSFTNCKGLATRPLGRTVTLCAVRPRDDENPAAEALERHLAERGCAE